MKKVTAPVRSIALVVALAAALSSAPARAQAPAPPDFSKVEIQTSQLAPNFYRFEAVGPALVGNAGILAGPDGIFMKPLRSIDLNTLELSPAAIERSDVCAVPAAAVVGEAMVAIVLAEALLEKFGGDSIDELLENWKAFRARTTARFSRA